MTTAVKEQEVGLLVRVFATYAAWLTMAVADVPFLVSAVLVVASPFLFGGVVWHLRKRHSLSTVNRLAFCGAVAFFPFLAIMMLFLRR